MYGWNNSIQCSSEGSLHLAGLGFLLCGAFMMAQARHHSSSYGQRASSVEETATFVHSSGDTGDILAPLQ